MFTKTAPFAKTATAILGLALAAAPALTAPAFAAEATRITVEYKDLDLTSEKGQRMLDRRLENAARKACGYESQNIGTRIISQEARSCYKQARSSAREVMAVAIRDASEDTRMGG